MTIETNVAIRIELIRATSLSLQATRNWPSFTKNDLKVTFYLFIGHWFFI